MANETSWTAGSRSLTGGYGDLDPEARGILLSLFVMGAEESALERLDENRRAVCARGWRDLVGDSDAKRARVLAAWRAEAVSTLPQGLEQLHPSWIVAALQGEPAHIIRLVLPDLPELARTWVLGMQGAGHTGSRAFGGIKACPAATKREVERAAFSWLAPLCECDSGPLSRNLCGLAFDELLTEVTRRGARTVGQSLVGAAPALRARAMAAAGEPWAEIMGAAAAQCTSDAGRKIATVHAKTRIPDSARTPSARLLHIGLSVLKSELVAEHPGSIYRFAGRLPAALGRPTIGW